MVEVYKRPLFERYYAPRLSLSALFILAYWIALIIVPFYLAYSSYGLWRRDGSYLEQPRIQFERKMILICDGFTSTSSTSQPLKIIWSTISEVNAVISPDQLRPIAVRDYQNDTNSDGIVDEMDLFLNVPLQANENIRRVVLLLFFQVNLSDRIGLQMDSMIPILYESQFSGKQFDVNGDLLFDQKNPLIVVSNRTYYASPILIPSQVQSIVDVFPSKLIRQNFDRNESLVFDYSRSSYWSTASSAMTPFPSFLMNVHFRIPKSTIKYVPTWGETMKWAWVQYVSVLVVFYWLVKQFVDFTFRNHIFETLTRKDTVPPAKMHQF